MVDSIIGPPHSGQGARTMIGDCDEGMELRENCHAVHVVIRLGEFHRQEAADDGDLM
jgi:hypothetical protein